ncbi:hypothetical protein HPB50_016126 [Hyalomma asiaticum]|uniref:Uncharacterized protein n=1 Tax=Hyalomma asiaticum TaxID=266040 RepID=A0ACB7SZF3_HYAAI|nr:hypothetical protein HPB50_016126 [Hyalomma asiaticum]
MCRLCAKEGASAAHILWDCSINRREANEKMTIPPQLEATTRIHDQKTHLNAIQQVSAAPQREPNERYRGEGGRRKEAAGPLSRAEVAREQSLKKYNA